MSSGVQQRIEELKQQERFIRDKTMEVARDALQVLLADLPLFVERELKKAFIANPDFAEAMPDEQLLALKQEIRTRGTEAARAIVKELDVPALWMSGHTFLEGAKTLEDHKDVWAIANRISDVVKQILEKYGFPVALRESLEIRYRQPSWFVAGRLMTTIAEKYWRKMTEWAEVQRELDELDNQSRREALKQRWDSVH